MKKLLLLSAAILAVLTLFNVKANAQTPLSATATVPLKIVLSDAIAITMKAADDVEFDYTTAADYQGSKTVGKTGHFTVVSNRAYKVAVKALAFTPATSGNSTVVPLNIIQVSVGTSPTAGTFNTATLGTADQALVTTSPATIAASYNINYTIPTAAALVGITKDTYATVVTYTATQL